MKIEVINSRTFSINGNHYQRGDYAIEYRNDSVRIRHKFTQQVIEGLGYTKWSLFKDSNNDKFDSYEDLVIALSLLVNSADTETTISNDKGTVTQLTSITTGVTLNKLNGIVTTVSSTLAADASASFTVTNSKVTASSNVIPSVIYAGAGNAEAKIASISEGSFVVKLTNTGTAALNAVVKVGFVVL